MVDKLFYNTVNTQTFSPCGNYLLAGNSYGDVAVYDLQKIVSPGEGLIPALRKAEYIFTVAKDITVCCMVTTEKFLVIGMVGEILGWDWKTITSSKNPKVSWVIQIPSSKDSLEKPYVNAMLQNGKDGLLYVGSGDNNIYVFSLEDGKLVRTMEGHDDYIHSIHQLGNNLVSSSDDGCVKLWDLREKNCVHTLQPHLNNKVARPELGNWIGAVCLNDDWLLCGGGPRLSLWHLRSLDMTTVFELEDLGIHVASFYDDRIMAGGAGRNFYHVSYTGDILAEIQTSSSAIYSAVFQESPIKVLCLAGNSSRIDFCTNFNYRDQILAFSA